MTSHAPWEMFPVDAESSLRTEHDSSKLDGETHARLLEAVEACLANDRYSLFVMAPEPDESFPTAGRGTFKHANE